MKFHEPEVSPKGKDSVMKALSLAKIPSKEKELTQMKVEDLHALQEELARKLELTNSLL